MAPRQFVDFLNWAKAYHEEGAKHLRAAGEEVESPLARDLLSYVSKHEELLGRMIADYEKDCPKHILNAWFKVSPDLKSVHHLYDVPFQADVKAPDIVSRLVAMHEDLILVYDVLRREALSTEVQSAIEDLLQNEKLAEIDEYRSGDYNGPLPT